MSEADISAVSHAPDFTPMPPSALGPTQESAPKPSQEDVLLGQMRGLAAQRARALTEKKVHHRRPLDPKHISESLLNLRGLVSKSDPPRNQKALDAIARRFREIGFAWSRDPQTGAIRFVNYPMLHGFAPTLAELLELDQSAFDQFQPRVQKRVQTLVDMGDAGRAFAAALIGLPISLPPPEVMDAVKAWLARALAGEPSTIYSPVCPDYEVGPDGRYTFNTLLDGVGLVARRVQAALPALWEFCKAHNLPVTFVVALGDSESENPANCSRVHLTQEEFVARLRGSQEAFRRSTDPEIPLELPMVTETGAWHETIARAREAAAVGNLTGALTLTADDFNDICDARASLYERWYGTSVDVADVLKQQAPEYMAMGTMAESRYPNVLILGGDAPAMAPFFQGLGTKVRPVLYLQGVRY